VTFPQPEAAGRKDKPGYLRQNPFLDQYKDAPETREFGMHQILLSHGMQPTKKVLTVKARLAILPIALTTMGTGE
jgi:hypothetical protein